MATESVDRKLVTAFVLLVAAVRFALTGVSGFTHSQGWTTTAGVAGFVLASVAFAGAFFVELRSALGRR